MKAPVYEAPQARSVIASYDRYEGAQEAVDSLSDQHFPVQHTAIVGSNLRMVESVRRRLNYGKAVLSGLGTGAWFGLLIGLLLGLFAITPAGWIWSIIWGLVIGAAFGIVYGLTSHAATGGKRDFESVSQVVAGRYDVLVDDDHAPRARQLLGIAEPGDGQPVPGQEGSPREGA